MGQSDSKQIEQKVLQLQKETHIPHNHGQKFLHDYHTNSTFVQDVKKFQDDKLKMFLKYFILQKYSVRSYNQKHNSTKRSKTNQSSVISQQQSKFDCINGIICFENYRITEQWNKICQILRSIIINGINRVQTLMQTTLSEIFNLIGIRQCYYVMCNKSNIQQKNMMFLSRNNSIEIKTVSIANSFPSSKKYKFKKIKKEELVQEKYFLSAQKFQSTDWFLQEIPSNNHVTTFIVSLKSSDLTDCKEMRIALERFLSQIGQIIYKILQIELPKQEKSEVGSLQMHSPKLKTLHKRVSQSYSLQQTHPLPEFCWNILKIYKNSYMFEHTYLLQKIRIQNKSSKKPLLCFPQNESITLELIRQKIKLYFQDLKTQNKSFEDQQQVQTFKFISQYQNTFKLIKTQINQYLQKFFYSITNSDHLIEMDFDQNTQLKIIIENNKIKQNSIMKRIRYLISQNNNKESNNQLSNITLLDIFKQHFIFQQFYKESFKKANQNVNFQQVFQKQGISLQFYFNNKQLYKIKITLAKEDLLQFPKQRFQKSSSSLLLNRINIQVTPSSNNSLKSSNQNFKKKYIESIHNINSHQQPQNKQNSLKNKRTKTQTQNNQEYESQCQLISMNKLKQSPQMLNRQALTFNSNDIQKLENISCSYDVYSPDLNFLQISKQKDSVKQMTKISFQMFFQTKFMKEKFDQLDVIGSQSFDYKQKLCNFLEELRKGYEEHKNPFHNFVHGVNVMHTTFIICKVGEIDSKLTQLAKFALIFSGLCHDVGHTGFNNAFEVASNSPIAERFNDISPLQNYHISRTLALLKNQSTNFLDFLSVEEKNKIRKLIISNILNTDMKEHFNVLKKFQDKIKASKQNPFKLNDLQDEKILCGMLIHSSDFGGSIKQFEICQQWSKKVNDQFMNQSNKEKQLCLPVTPFMLNLDNPLILAKNQIGFLKFMVQPLYRALHQSWTSQNLLSSMYTRVNSNIHRWDSIIKQLTQQVKVQQKN